MADRTARGVGTNSAAGHAHGVQLTGTASLAEALGTGFLVFIGAGSIPATMMLGNAGKVPFSMADLGMISFA
jgi:hypothetical protein